MIRRIGRPSYRTLAVLLAGAVLWSASANGLLRAGPSDSAELLLPALFAVSGAAVLALCHIEERRWPIEVVFFGACATVLGPLWAFGVAAACRFVRWCVSGRTRTPFAHFGELAAAGGGALASSVATGWLASVLFFIVWVALRGSTAAPALSIAGFGVLLSGLAESNGAVWTVLGLAPFFLLGSIAQEEADAGWEHRQLLQTLTLMLQRAHPYTHSHIERVARLAQRTAIHLGLSEARADLVQRAAKLHDVGKIAVDEEILDKPGRLTPDEYAHVKLHAPYGAAILENIDELRAIADWIRCHHERPDGNGYPRGLSGDEIPLEAKIIAVADAFDAMTGGFLEGERRPYRDPISPAEALAELERCAGSQFDRRVVAAFRTALIEEGTR